MSPLDQGHTPNVLHKVILHKHGKKTKEKYKTLNYNKLIHLLDTFFLCVRLHSVIYPRKS
jgi:hypothetical protein